MREFELKSTGEMRQLSVTTYIYKSLIISSTCIRTSTYFFSVRSSGLGQIIFYASSARQRLR